MNSTTSLSFVRHGQVHNPGAVFYGRLPGFGLDGQGREQARRAGRAFSGIHLSAVFSSPLLRARQTAREVLAACDSARKLHISARLTEVRTCFEGRPSAEVDALKDDIYTGAAPEFEQPADIVSRALAFMQQVRSRYAGSRVAAVTHGDIIVFMILWAAGLPLTPDNKMRLSRTRVLNGYPATGSITTFTFTTHAPDERPLVRYMIPA